MKKQLIYLLLFIQCGLYLNAQNIGIGDPSPSAKLTIRGSETTPEGQAAGIKLQNSSATNTWWLRAGATGTTTPANGFSIADNFGYHFTMNQGGNIGLGINPIAARLHVNGMMKLEGTNLFEFGAGVAGKEVNAGKIGYNAFGQNALTFIGAGTNATNRSVFFYAEGGTTFTGPVNVGGTLQMNGNAGAPGQVLTSNGAADPEWKEQAYGNTTRFAVNYNETVSSTALGSFPLTTQYNLNPADVSIAANSFTINKTGLYHFDFYLHYAGASTTQPSITTYLSGAPTSGSLMLLKDEQVTAVTSGGIYNGNWHFGQDIHIVAPTTVTLSRYFLNVSAFSVVSGTLLCHLIQ